VIFVPPDLVPYYIEALNVMNEYLMTINASGFLASLFQKKEKRKKRKPHDKTHHDFG
jgi:hypothetical protein